MKVRDFSFDTDAYAKLWAKGTIGAETVELPRNDIASLSEWSRWLKSFARRQSRIKGKARLEAFSNLLLMTQGASTLNKFVLSKIREEKLWEYSDSDKDAFFAEIKRRLETKSGEAPG